MKRIFALFLGLVTLLSLFSCEKEEETATGDAINTEVAGTKEETVTDAGPVEYIKVENPLTPQMLADIPIATNGMSTDELRQICLRFLHLQVSFPWVANQDYHYLVERQVHNVKIREGQLYAGIPYVNVASGNLYRILERYDSQTGVLDLSNVANDNIVFGTACSGSACWAWGRVINSANYSWTNDMTQKNGFIPLGPYTYDPELERFDATGSNSCKLIAERNGEQVMYQSYTKLLPADCLVNDGHVMLAASEPTIVYKEDGSGEIDGEKSYILYSEQGMYRNLPYQMREQSDGTTYSIQGAVEVKMTFKTLFSSGYLPHTFKEFLGQDPVEDAEVKFELPEGVTEGALHKFGVISANYPISDVFVTIKNQKDEVVFQYAKRARNHFTKSFQMLEILPNTILTPYEKVGGHKIELSCQLSNGTKPVFYQAELTAS